MKLDRFLSELGSEKGAPGGGAAAALTGAAGAGLVEMVARLNDKRLKKSSQAHKKASLLRVRLLQLIQEDAKAFTAIQRAYATRKSKPSQWQSVLKKGALAPLAICEACSAAALLAKSELSRTSPWLMSDAKESLILLKAAFQSAVLNVEVNLKLVQDASFNQKCRNRIKTLYVHVR